MKNFASCLRQYRTLTSMLLSLLAAPAADSHATNILPSVEKNQPVRVVNERVCLSPEEEKLAALINDYRVRHNLSPIPVTISLSAVAKNHVIDLSENTPHLKVLPLNGKPCDLHSWSDQGSWTPVCYTNDHRFAEQMWNKPREITKNIYSGDGYENAYWISSRDLSVERVFQSWVKSPRHISLILETDCWEGSKWPAMGVGVHKNAASVWFGDQKDPLGTISLCSSKSLNNQDRKTILSE